LNFALFTISSFLFLAGATSASTYAMSASAYCGSGGGGGNGGGGGGTYSLQMSSVAAAPRRSFGYGGARGAATPSKKVSGDSFFSRKERKTITDKSKHRRKCKNKLNSIDKHHLFYKKKREALFLALSLAF
jgi:hypothetical protein